jgi:hypothetical protein
MTIDELKMEMERRFEQVNRRCDRLDLRLEELAAQDRLMNENLMAGIRKLCQGLDAAVARWDRLNAGFARHGAWLENHELRLNQVDEGKPRRV